MSGSGNMGRVQSADVTPILTPIGGLASSDVAGALGELDSRSIFLRNRIISADFTVQANYFAVWIRPRIQQGVKLRIEAGGTLRVMG